MFKIEKIDLDSVDMAILYTSLLKYRAACIRSDCFSTDFVSMLDCLANKIKSCASKDILHHLGVELE